MALLPSSELAVAGGLAAVGFIVNGIIGVSTTWFLRAFTPMCRIDAVTVGSFYGSDSAGTFVTCWGILATWAMPTHCWLTMKTRCLPTRGDLHENSRSPRSLSKIRVTYPSSPKVCVEA